MSWRYRSVLDDVIMKVFSSTGRRGKRCELHVVFASINIEVDVVLKVSLFVVIGLDSTRLGSTAKMIYFCQTACREAAAVGFRLTLDGSQHGRRPGLLANGAALPPLTRGGRNKGRKVT